MQSPPNANGPGPPRTRAAARPHRRGLTLVELLFVISLISVLFGIGVGMLSDLDPAERAAVGLVQNVLRSARNTAVARGAPARVRIDPEQRALEAEGLAVVGTWHFESPPLEGAFGLDGRVGGADVEELVARGYRGEGLAFVGAADEVRVEVPVQDDPAFDLARGFAVELAVRRDEAHGARLLTIGRSFYVEVDAAGAVGAYLIPKLVDEAGRPTPGARVWVRTEAGALPLGRWARLALRYDRRTFACSVDGLVLAERDEAAEVWKVDEPLVLSGGRSAFPGVVDELVVAAVSAEERALLPGGVTFGASTPDEILFAPDGSLDPRASAGPLEIVLEFPSGRVETVRVNPYGTVE